MKMKLLLVQWPSMIGNEAFFFEQFGYEVTVTYILVLQNIEDIETDLKREGISLGDFDVIVLAVAGGPPPESDSYVFAEHSVRVLQNKLRTFESNSGKHIPLVGKNWGLSHDVEVSQSKLFGGLFLGNQIPFEQISSVLQGKPFFLG